MSEHLNFLLCSFILQSTLCLPLIAYGRTHVHLKMHAFFLVGAVRDWDLCHGAQHACTYCRVYQCQKIRRQGFQMGMCMWMCAVLFKWVEWKHIITSPCWRLSSDCPSSITCYLSHTHIPICFFRSLHSLPRASTSRWVVVQVVVDWMIEASSSSWSTRKWRSVLIGAVLWSTHVCLVLFLTQFPWQ